MNGIVERYDNLSASDIRWLDRALGIAQNSTMRMKHGAIIIKGGRVLAIGLNSIRNIPSDRIPSGDISWHAEVAAIKSAGKSDLNGAKLYVARINRSGNPALSRPCDSCSNAIRRIGITKVIYTT